MRIIYFYQNQQFLEINTIAGCLPYFGINRMINILYIDIFILNSKYYVRTVSFMSNSRILAIKLKFLNMKLFQACNYSKAIM